MPTITTCRAAGAGAGAVGTAARAAGGRGSGTGSAAHTATPAAAGHARRTQLLIWPTVAVAGVFPPLAGSSAGADRLVGRARLDRERAGRGAGRRGGRQRRGPAGGGVSARRLRRRRGGDVEERAAGRDVVAEGREDLVVFWL